MKLTNQQMFLLLLRHFADLGLWQPEAEANQNYKVVCPFHEDRNASLQINPAQAFYYCYADCGAKGGPLELYKDCYKVQHPNKQLPSDIQCLLAIKRICQNALQTEQGSNENSLPMPARNITSYTSNNASVKKLSYREAITQARDFYYNLPATNWYRPGSEEGIECKLYMKRRGFSVLTLTKAEAKASYNKWYPIVFPMFENGIFRGYVMRTFDAEIEAERKYMYNRGFRRETCLPGTYGRGNDTVLLVEGFLDKLKANQLGITQAAAILGWKLTPKQIEKLQKAGIKHIICATDNDEAGKKGYRYMKRLETAGLFKVTRLRYPKGVKDMGDVKAGTEQAEHILNQLHKHRKIFK